MDKDTEQPCTACSWTPKRQDACRYNSHVNLFYGVGDRGVWELGSKLVLKERSADAPPAHLEAKNLQFIRENTTIPGPDIVEEWSEDNGCYFLLTTRVQGTSLKEAWPTLTETQKNSIAQETAQYLQQLRKITSKTLQSVDNGPLYSAFLFASGNGLPHGPLTSDKQLWKEMAKGLEGFADDDIPRLGQQMPRAEPYTFTHGDLSTSNIIVKDGSLAGIIDWEVSGYYPVWWEFAATAIGQDDDDIVWKELLRKHMEDFTAGREFWREYYRCVLKQYPN